MEGPTYWNQIAVQVWISQQNSENLQKHFKEIEIQITGALERFIGKVKQGFSKARLLNDPNDNFFQSFTVLEALSDGAEGQDLGIFLCWLNEQYRLGKFFIPVTVYFGKNDSHTFRPYQQWQKDKVLLPFERETIKC